MTPRFPPTIPRRSARGFTLLEALLALFIFSTAVISLVEGINMAASTVLLSRRERAVQARLETMLLEASRSPDLLAKARNNESQKTTVKEGDVSYTTNTVALELKNVDDQPLPDMFGVSVLAQWSEGNQGHERLAETWVFAPMFQPRLEPRR